MYGCVRIHVWVSAEARKGNGIPWSWRYTGGCELPGVGAGNRTLVFYKNSKLLWPPAFSYSQEKFLTEKKIGGKIVSSKFWLGTEDTIPTRHFKLRLNVLNTSAAHFLSLSRACLLYLYERRKWLLQTGFAGIPEFDKRSRIEISNMLRAFINDDR